MRLPVIEIMDTTLRDGEQTTGVSFTRSEKLSIFRLLVEELHIPRVEVASARVSSGEFETVKRICEWAKQNGHLDKAEVLGFIDGGQSNSFSWMVLTSTGNILPAVRQEYHLLLTIPKITRC